MVLQESSSPSVACKEFSPYTVVSDRVGPDSPQHSVLRVTEPETLPRKNTPPHDLCVNNDAGMSNSPPPLNTLKSPVSSSSLGEISVPKEISPYLSVNNYAVIAASSSLDVLKCVDRSRESSVQEETPPRLGAFNDNAIPSSPTHSMHRRAETEAFAGKSSLPHHLSVNNDNAMLNSSIHPVCSGSEQENVVHPASVRKDHLSKVLINAVIKHPQMDAASNNPLPPTNTITVPVISIAANNDAPCRRKRKVKSEKSESFGEVDLNAYNFPYTFQDFFKLTGTPTLFIHKI